MLLHGFTGSGRSMARVARSFERDHETIAVDLLGHGRSSAPADAAAYAFDACVEDALAALEATGHEWAHWLGYSMGARLALGCAVRQPERVASLILIGARVGITDPTDRESRRREDEALARRIEREGVEAFVDTWMRQPLFASQQRLGRAFLAEARRERLVHSAQGLANSLRGMGPGAQPSLLDALPKLTMPTLLVVGALDAKFLEAAREIAKHLPRAELCEIDDAGHAVHLEQPDIFAHVARDFLRQVPRPVQVSPTHGEDK